MFISVKSAPWITICRALSEWFLRSSRLFLSFSILTSVVVTLSLKLVTGSEKAFTLDEKIINIFEGNPIDRSTPL